MKRILLVTIWTSLLLVDTSGQDHPYTFNIGGGVASNAVLRSGSSDGFGYNAGAGITFRIGDSYVKFYTELRYHHAFHKGIDTQVLPLTFGICY